MPIVGSRVERVNPLARLDSRTKRRALRCIRRGATGDAPVGVDLEAIAFFWGRSQVRSLRLAWPLVFILFGGALTDTEAWIQIGRIAFAIVLVPLIVYAVRDVRSCRRYLAASELAVRTAADDEDGSTYG
ncbi:hypothetical protein FOE78_04620 [Microlunatus elymi]|uniref:Uncharacterized protein n=1 Tax=Microlunatus elymi TaxID=2596828 RepID=A0A516PVS7_9ACTN|nr:hypothetical protein [Microlunatus elymi]QDP95287.1 hypothetical protein FOE78_04620 [Microlunatus elymi]